jgi:dolichyl-phosphate-mannose--protein O-mannosyl transferase
MKKLLSLFGSEYFLVGLLMALSLVTRFIFFGWPNQIVFDEVYFAQFVTHYFDKEYYFDIHPPLAKIIMASAARVSGIKPDLSFKFQSISTPYPDNFYKLLRGIVSFFGFLIPLLAYLFVRALFADKWAAFFAGLCAVFDNALLVQSRYILTDAFMLAFGMGALWCAARYAGIRQAIPARDRRRVFLIGMGLLLGAAVSVKWTALVFIGIAAIILLVGAYRHSEMKRGIKALAAAFAIVAVFYYAVMAYHINALPFSGPGDAFMSPQFQSTLMGNPNYGKNPVPPTTFQKVIELNKVMYTANAGITASHPYGSRWYEWPSMARPIYYWVSPQGQGVFARIYLLGNPLVWWFGAVAMAILTFWLIAQLFKKRKSPNFAALGILAAGYWANLLPYIFISRVAFLYHYFPSFLFMLGVVGYVLSRMSRKYWYVVGAFLALMLYLFIYFAPLSYGLPLPDAQYQQRVWFPSWL